MLEPALFGFKILFLLLLYLFIFRLVRSMARDLQPAAEPIAMPAKAPARQPAVNLSPAAAAPQPAPVPAFAGAPQPAAPRRERAPIPAKPVEASEAGATREFDYLVSKLQPRLVVQHSKVLDDGKIFLLKGGATIGRSPGSDIVLADEYVSQTHARVFARKQFLYLEDLGSTNGSFVDGRRIEGEHQIKPGQEIVIGDTIFRYEE